MNARIKKVLRIAAVPFSLMLICGYVAFRASGCQAVGTKADPIVVAPEAAGAPAQQDSMMFSGSKSGAMFTPAAPKLGHNTKMISGSKSGPVASPEDFTPLFQPSEPFNVPPATPNAPATKPSQPSQPSQPPAK